MRKLKFAVGDDIFVGREGLIIHIGPTKGEYAVGVRGRSHAVTRLHGGGDVGLDTHNRARDAGGELTAPSFDQ